MLHAIPCMTQNSTATGYDDWPVLRNLTDEDLDTIAQCSAVTILPGHRKKLLLASKDLRVQVWSTVRVNYMSIPCPEGELEMLDCRSDH